MRNDKKHIMFLDCFHAREKIRLYILIITGLTVFQCIVST